MAPKRNAAAELGGKLLAVLQAQRALGEEAYPLTLQRLTELAGPPVSPEQVKEAVGKKPFKDQAVLASSRTKGPAGLVSLVGDIDRLAGDPRLLESALAPLCTPEESLWPLSKVGAKIENAKLRKPFEQAVQRQVRENTLPDGVGGRLEKNKPHLFLTKYPPRDPDELLADKLLRVLDAQRRLGDDSYPLPLQRLVELTAPQAKTTLVNKALGRPAVKDKLLLLDPKNRRIPVAFVEDRDRLLSSPALLEQLMRTQRKPAGAVSAETLVPKRSAYFQAVREAVNREIDAGLLPPSVGWLWFGKKKLLFFHEDVHHGRPTNGQAAAAQPAPAAEAPADFATTFDDAFQRINREKGGHNFVSLVDLRRALPVAPDAFNTELRKLRVAGRYTLSGAEGRHGLSPEERQAGIVEDGSLLLYVSRKKP